MFSPEQAILVVIDIQGKLAYLMDQKETLFKNVKGLIQTAQFLCLPIVLTEQVPEKIGATIPEIKDLLPELQPIKKNSFSCYLDKSFLTRIQSLKRKQIIVCGIEAHVCVIQTVLDLLENKYSVQVVADAISSRKAENKCYALERMRKEGADITTCEMIVTELLRTSTHPRFKEVLNLIK